MVLPPPAIRDTPLTTLTCRFPMVIPAACPQPDNAYFCRLVLLSSTTLLPVMPRLRLPTVGAYATVWFAPACCWTTSRACCYRSSGHFTTARCSSLNPAACYRFYRFYCRYARHHGHADCRAFHLPTFLEPRAYSVAYQHFFDAHCAYLHASAAACRMPVYS